MATRMSTALASGENSRETAISAVQLAKEKTGPDEDMKLCIVYANPDYDLQEVIKAIREIIGNVPLIGCSSTGEFVSDKMLTGAIAITIITSNQFEVRLGKATHFNKDIPSAVKQATEDFAANSANKGIKAGWRGRTLLLFTDGLAGHGEALIDALISQTGLQYQLFGGAAADNAKFEKTYVFCNDEVLTDTFVVAEILTENPFSIAADHGWSKIDGPYRVTRAESNILYELNGTPAWEIYKSFAEKRDLPILEGKENNFLMQYILGIEKNNTEKPNLRVPLGLNSDGSLLCAAEVFEGDIIYIMTSENNKGVINGGSAAADKAKKNLVSEEIAGALVFECVATRLQLADEFASQVSTTAYAVKPNQLMGCACYGQLARTQNDFTGLGCATSLICLVPA